MKGVDFFFISSFFSMRFLWRSSLFPLLLLLLLSLSASKALVLLAPPSSHYGYYDASRRALFDFYADFVRATGSVGERVVLVVTNSSRPGWDDGSYRELSKRLLNDPNLNYNSTIREDVWFSNLDDIWVRDFFPTQLDDVRLAQFRFAPAYLDRAAVRYIQQSLNELLNDWDFPGLIPLSKRDEDGNMLVLDGGGIVLDVENSAAVATERVLRDNPFLAGRKEEKGLGAAAKCCPSDPYGILSLESSSRSSNKSSVFFTKEEVSIGEQALARKLGYDKVAIVPEEPGAPRLGHIDGLCNWLAPGVLALSNFSNPSLYENYREQLLLKLGSSTSSSSIEIVPLPYAVSENVYTDGFESSSGIYVNFLRTQTAIYMPVFSIPQDEIALEVARKHSDLPVVPVNATEVAIMGGSVRCLSQHLWGDNADHLSRRVLARLEEENTERAMASAATGSACGSCVLLLLLLTAVVSLIL